MEQLRGKWLLLVLAVSAAFFLAGCGLAERYKEIYEALESGTEQKEKSQNIPQSGDKGQPGPKEQVQAEEANTQADFNVPEHSAAQEAGEAEELYADCYAYQALETSKKQVYQEVLAAILGHEEKVSLPTTDVDVLEEAYKAVCADHGGLFWVSGYVYTQYTRGGDLIGMDFAPKYTMGEAQRNEIQKQIDASTEELLAGVSITDPDYDKAKYVFEILVQNVDYDAASENNQNIISTFLNRATVCQGYAAGAQYLLRLLGIPSTVVTGVANGESHAWNLIRLDGDYYYMDVTWGNSRYLDSESQIEKYVNYNYMAVTSEEIERTHQADRSFALPVCASRKDNYFIRENRFFEVWDPDAVGAVLAEAWNTGKKSAAVKFASKELYGQAIAYFIGEQHIADYCEGITSIFYLEDQELFVVTFHF